MTQVNKEYLRKQKVQKVPNAMDLPMRKAYRHHPAMQNDRHSVTESNPFCSQSPQLSPQLLCESSTLDWALALPQPFLVADN
eukprot:6462569-Amphidinium_carterae.1